MGDQRKRGRPSRYSDVAIEMAHNLRLVYNRPLRQTEGFIKSIFRLMALDLQVPDHTTLSRRGKTLPLSRMVSAADSPVVILDSTGLKVFGEKEWMNTKHGTKQRKSWRKLHLAISADGLILGSTLTHHQGSDVSQVEELLQGIEGPLKEVMGDGGYDHPATYQAVEAHQEKGNQEADIRVIVPPNTGFQRTQDKDPFQRLKNIGFIEDKGKKAWQDQTDYGRRALVENAMHRYKTLIGNKLKSRTLEGQKKETQIAVNILNKMRTLAFSRAQIST